MRAQQALLQQRNEIDLLKRDIDKRNARLKELMETVREQNHDLTMKVRLKTKDLRQSRLSVIARLARVAEFRDKETGGPHLPHRPLQRPRGPEMRPLDRGLRGAIPRQSPPRRGQGGDPGLDPPQARSPQSRGTVRHADPYLDRRRAPRRGREQAPQEREGRRSLPP